MKKLSRRQVILGMGTATTGALLAPLVSARRDASAITPSRYPTCTVTPEQTEGPFYFETKLIRSDIAEGRPGTPLHLKLKIVEGESCDPVRDAIVDIWCCDAMGEYSGYETVYTEDGRFKEQRGLPRDDSRHSDDRRPGFHQEPNNEKTFLRGAQVTDANGEVGFRMIYPGWYPGRATHIHVKVYLDDSEVFTGQMYFPETTNDSVYSGGVYSNKEGRRTRNEDDGTFRRAGNGPLVELTEVDDGYVATLTYGLQR